MAEWPQIIPLGEAALTVRLGEAIAPELNAKVHALAASLQAANVPGVRELVPAYAALTVFFDPLFTDGDTLGGLALAHVQSLPPHPAASGRDVVLPVRYDGPDLAEVATLTGMSAAEVIARHSGRTYRVYLLGFVPGFAYLGDLDPALVLPRRKAPRQRVPAGSVAIAGAQTGVYPLETPGGWHLIGHTDVELFDPARGEPFLLQPGDTVRFEARP